jgi:alpha-tubulin suppressor-like RCC1 family protein
MRIVALLVVLIAVLSCRDNTSPLVVFPPGQFTTVSAGSAHACALDTLGRAWCWGSNSEGELGVARVPCTVGTTCLGPPALVSQDLRFTSISAGSAYTCAVKSDGTAYCWGSNSSGKLGALTPPATNCDRTVCAETPLAVSGGFSFSQIVAGDETTCGVTTTGVGKCWGSNFGGVLGKPFPAVAASSTPVSLVLPSSGDSTWESVSRGTPYSNCAITPNHLAACWGDNGAGELGIGAIAAGTATLPMLAATTTPLHGVTVGGLFVCALDAAGSAYCWGISTDSSLGVGLAAGGVPCTPTSGKATCYSSPTKVGGGLVFSSLSAGGGHVCGVTPAGEGHCWGLNSSSEIGTGPLSSQATYVAYPFPVYGGLHFTAISAGDDFTCGVTTDRNAWCWGSNLNGQLGQNPTDSVTTTFPIVSSGIPLRIIAKNP